jgi:hypothetical protein
MDQAARYLVYTAPHEEDRTDEHLELARLVLAGRTFDAGNVLETHLAKSLTYVEESLTHATVT